MRNCVLSQPTVSMLKRGSRGTGEGRIRRVKFVIIYRRAPGIVFMYCFFPRESEFGAGLNPVQEASLNLESLTQSKRLH